MRDMARVGLVHVTKGQQRSQGRAMSDPVRIIDLLGIARQCGGGVVVIYSSRVFKLLIFSHPKTRQ